MTRKYYICYSTYMSNEPVITIYSTPTCAFCHMTKEYLKGLNVPYKESDITTDEAGFKFVIEKTGQPAVPVIDIDGEIIVGFNRPQIDGALREKHLVK